jgi:transducin (beta)-like 1
LLCRTIRICRVSDEGVSAYRVLEGHLDEVNSINWSPDGTLLASCSDDGTAKIWTIDNGLKHNLVGHAQEIYTVRWTPTGRGTNRPNDPLYLCTASFDGTVKVITLVL